MSDALANALSGEAPTIARSAPAVVNPLAGIGTAQELIGRMQGLDKSLSERTMGEAYAKSIDPKTGRLDPLELNKNLAADPRNAYSMRTGVESSQALQGKQFELNSAQNAALNNAITAALAGDDAGLKARVAQQSQQLITSGMLPADRVIGSLLELDKDPAVMRQQLMTRHTQTLPVETREQILSGKPVTVTGPGGTLIGGTVNPRGGAVNQAPQQTGLQQGQSPEDENTIVKIGTNPDGSDRMGTKRQARNLAEGRDANDNGPHAGGAGAGAGVLPGRLYRNGQGPATAATPAPAITPTAPGATPPPAPAPQQPGFTIGQGPATAAAQATTGTKSADAFQDIVQQSVKARSQDALLATLLSDAQGFRPGPGADLATTIKRTILGAGAQFGTTFGVDVDKLAKQESFVKIANQLADAQGAGSNERLRVQAGSNPSLHNTPAGLDFIVRQLRGNTDYIRAREQLAAGHTDKADIAGFEAKVGANLDPRVFQYERLTPDQKKDYFSGLTDKAAFVKAHDWAAAHKLIGGGGTVAPAVPAAQPPPPPRPPPQVPTGY